MNRSVRVGLLILGLATLSGCSAEQKADLPRSPCEARLSDLDPRKVSEETLVICEKAIAADPDDRQLLQAMSDARMKIETAARAGSQDAQYALGFLFERGLGERHSKIDALMWYYRASSQGHQMAGERQRRLAGIVSMGS